MFCQVCVYNQVIKSIVFIKLHVMHESVDFQLTNFFFDEGDNMCTSSKYYQLIENMSHYQFLWW